jgi:hypothetical protein
MTRLSRSSRVPSLRGPDCGPGAPFARAGAVSSLVLLGVALFAAASAGCIFIDDINHAPVASLAVSDGMMKIPAGQTLVTLPAKCMVLTLDASGSRDPDGISDTLTFLWTIDGEPANPSDSITFSSSGSTATLSFIESGMHRVAVTAFDRRAAPSVPAAIDFVVDDAPPMAHLSTSVQPGACGDYAAGVQIPLFGGMSTDLDATCSKETLTYQFTVAVPMGSQGKTLAAGSCDGDPKALDRACLTPDVPGSYTITLVVQDGFQRPAAMQSTDGQTASMTFQVADDRPPCMDGFDPPPGLYLLDRAMPQTFEVTEVLDDLDPYPPTSPPASFRHFVWSLWRASDPVWRELSAFDGNALLVDGSDFALDELVQIRVAAHDRVARDTSACDPAQATCDYSTAYPNAMNCFGNGVTCEAWVTWQARFR